MPSVVAQIFSLSDRRKSSSAAITYISTRFRGGEQSYAQRFISSPSIAFLLPVTGFLILLINYTKAELGLWGSEERGLSEFNLSFDFLCFLGLIFPLLSSQIRSIPLVVYFRYTLVHTPLLLLILYTSKTFVSKEATHFNSPLCSLCIQIFNQLASCKHLFFFFFF